MAIPDRAAFVQSEYRYEEVEDFTVSADYPSATVLVIDTQLGEADATAVAGMFIAEFSVSKRTWSGTYNGLIDDFSSPPRFIINDPKQNLFNVVGRWIDGSVIALTNQTQIVLRVG